MAKDDFYLQKGGTCPQCIELTSVKIDRETGKIIEMCPECKRVWLYSRPLLKEIQERVAFLVKKYKISDIESKQINMLQKLTR